MNIHTNPELIRGGSLDLHSPRRLLAVVTACLALAACHNPESRSDTPTPDTPTEVGTHPAAASTAPSRGPLYKPTNNPCDLVDHQLLAQLLGPDINDVTPPQYTRNKILTAMACHRSYSRPGAGATLVPVRIQLADPAAIEAQYQGLRRLIEGRTAVTDVPGLGQSAYTYLDKSIGPQLALYDGNAYLTIGATPIAEPAPPTPPTLQALIQVAQKVLARLTSGKQ